MATVIPVLLAAWWVLRWQGRLWRKTVADRAGEAIEALRHSLGGEVRPRWTGWEIRSRRARVAFQGGLLGLRTKIRGPGRRCVRQGLLTAEEVACVLRAWEIPADGQGPRGG